MCFDSLQDFFGDVIILSGDVPLISHMTLESLINKQIDENLNASVLTAELDDPDGYDVELYQAVEPSE